MKLNKVKYEHFLFYALWLLLIINLGQTIFSLLCSGYILFDNIEHLRAAYFVSLGDVPYRDFFEHHHPLLWYLLSPFIAFLPYDTISAIYGGRLICLLFSLIGGFFVYKTEKNFFGGPLCALFCLNLYFCAVDYISLSGLFQIKPDIFQRCCFFVGLYFLFCYFRYQKFRDLQICALFWTLAFLFLQTTVFYVAPFTLPVGYFLYKKPQRWKDFAKAAVVPLIIIIGCIAVMWKNNMLPRYYETNWVLNSVMSYIWLQIKENYFKVLYMSDILLLVAAAFFFLLHNKKFNIYTVSLLCALIIEFLLRIFYVSHVYYITWLLIYAAMLVAPFLTQMSRKFKSVFVLFIAVWFMHLYGNLTTVDCKKFFTLANYISQTNGETICAKVFQNRHNYYWMYPSIEMLDDVLFNPVSDYDLTAIYTQENSKILVAPPMETEGYYAKIIRNIRKGIDLNKEQKTILQRHIVDDFVKENYIKIDENIYRRKDALPGDK